MELKMRSMLGDIHIGLYVVLCIISIGFNIVDLPDIIVETYHEKKEWLLKRKEEAKIKKVDKEI